MNDLGRVALWFSTALVACYLAVGLHIKPQSIQANVYQLATDKGLKALKCHPSIHAGVVLCQVRN